MGSSSPGSPTPQGLTKSNLKALSLLFTGDKKSFQSIFDLQPELAKLLDAEAASAATRGLETTQRVSTETQSFLENDEGLLGKTFREGLAGPGLSDQEASFIQERIAKEQAGRGVFQSPISGTQAGLLSGAFGIQRGDVRLNRSLGLLSGLSGQSLGLQTGSPTLGQFNTQAATSSGLAQLGAQTGIANQQASFSEGQAVGAFGGQAASLAFLI